MIQLSFHIQSTHPLGTLPEPLESTPMDDGFRLTGVWFHDDLSAARKEIGSALLFYPQDSQIRCLFTGRTQSLADWQDEWEHLPRIGNTFEVRYAHAEGLIFARLFGAYQLGDSDIVLTAREDIPIDEIFAVLSSWAKYRLHKPFEKPKWDRPFPYGYGLFSFAEYSVGDAHFWELMRDLLGSDHLRLAFDERMKTPSPYILIECERPDRPEDPYVIGASHTLFTRIQQKSTLSRLRDFYEDTAWTASLSTFDSPNSQEVALACDAFVNKPEENFFAYREAAKSDADSGWRFACLDPEHAHDEKTLRILPLAVAMKDREPFCNYLSLPVGWAVTYEEGVHWTTPPGEERSFADDPEGKLPPSVDALSATSFDPS